MINFYEIDISKLIRHPLKVKRNLFQVKPEDHEEMRRYLEAGLKLDFQRNCDRWNFNFETETTLDPNGNFIWGSPSPVKINRKRKLQESPYDSASELYFKPIEIQSNVTSPQVSVIKPLARSQNDKKNPAWRSKQSLITDYLQKSKRTLTFNKETEHSDDRPKLKKAKVGDS